MDKYSIDSDIKFPDMKNYDMHKPGEMALYLAHCDLFPFGSVIKNSKMTLNMINKSYNEIADFARKHGDYNLESQAMISNFLSSTQVDLLTQYSLLITLVSIFEEAVTTLCNIYFEFNKLNVKLLETKGTGLIRAKAYLKDHVGILGFTNNKYWEYVDAICEARHMIVHNGGRISKNFHKFDKFKIGYRDEDKKIYIESDDVFKMYTGILSFMDISFRIEPKKA